MKKIKVLALIMVFAFAALGGAYALWWDSLFLKETVSTGTVNLQWCECTRSSDPGDNYTGYTATSGVGKDVYQGDKDSMDPNNPNDPKNIGAKQVAVTSDTDLETLPALAEGETETRYDYDLMTIKLINGYPGYQEYVESMIFNKGTVPTKFIVTLEDGTAIPAWMHFQIVDASSGVVYYDNLNEVNLLEGKQLDPGDCIHIKIIERILQEAPQKATANFTLKLKGVQWNEYKFELPNAITARTPIAQ